MPPPHAVCNGKQEPTKNCFGLRNGCKHTHGLFLFVALALAEQFSKLSRSVSRWTVQWHTHNICSVKMWICCVDMSGNTILIWTTKQFLTYLFNTSISNAWKWVSDIRHPDRFLNCSKMVTTIDEESLANCRLGSLMWPVWWMFWDFQAKRSQRQGAFGSGAGWDSCSVGVPGSSRGEGLSRFFLENILHNFFGSDRGIVRDK